MGRFELVRVSIALKSSKYKVRSSNFVYQLVRVKLVKLLLGYLHNFHKVANKNISTLCNLDQGMNTLK
jgi:hypothetical protein